MESFGGTGWVVLFFGGNGVGWYPPVFPSPLSGNLIKEAGEDWKDMFIL